MRAYSLTTFCLLMACASPPTPVRALAPADPLATPAVPDDGGSLPAPPATRIWLRVDDETRSKILPPLKDIAGPILVELLPNGSLRTAEPSERRELTLPNAIRRWPSAVAGLGLFVERTVEIFLGAPDGPVIGTVLPGAYLPVIAYGPRVTEVALPGYKVRSAANWDPVRVFVDSSALGTAAPPLLPDPPAKADYRDHELPLSATKGGMPFASTVCGPLRVVAREGQVAKVSQFASGVEVQGWLSKEPDERRGSHVCPPRVLRKEDAREGSRGTETSRLPAGYLTFAAMAPTRDPLKSLLDTGGSLFWVVPADGDELKCIAWQAKLRPNGVSKSQLGSLQYKADLRRTVDKERRQVSSFELGYSPGEGDRTSLVHLLGPISYVGARADAVALCGAAYVIVELAADHVTLLRGEYPGGIVAYHPDDTEVWYFNRQGCEAAAAGSRRQTLASASPVHQGC